MKNYPSLAIGLTIGIFVGSVLGGFAMKLYHTPADETKKIFANVNGHPIYGKEVLDSVQESEQDNMDRIYALKRSATLAAIDQQLISEEVHRRGLNDETQLRQALASSVASQDISPQEIEDFAKTLNLSPKQIRPQQLNGIKLQIRNKKIVDAFTKMMIELRKNADIQWFLENPAKKIEVNKNTDTVNNLLVGSPEAPLKIQIYTRYHCPFCSRIPEKIQALQDRLPNKLAFYLHFVMDENEDSFIFHSAESSFCFQEQGQLKAYFDTALKEPPTSDADIVSLAKKLQLNPDAIEKCLSSRKYKNIILSDIEFAKKNKIETAPTFVFNKIPINSMMPIDELVTLLKY